MSSTGSIHTDRWLRVKAIFQEAVELPAEKRARFLDTACVGDDAGDIRASVEDLLGSDGDSMAFLEPPTLSAVRDAIQEEERSSLIDTRIGAYRLVREIAAGGMGVVYLAERDDGQFEQRVAIKIIKRGMDTEELLRRFHNERQVLANLVHPYIARLLDGGATDDGRPFLVMEYVEGESLDSYCDRHSLTIRQRLELFLKVCEAVHFAHANLIVHRDLKPSNILVDQHGSPKLLDFGIAKLLDVDAGIDASVTVDRGRFMTPRYASPEQIRGDTVTTGSDVYSLGMILYELLTGHRAYDFGGQSTRRDLERIICEQLPVAPSTVVGRTERQTGATGEFRLITPESVSSVREGRVERLRRRLAGDLDNVTLMALRKEPTRRYVTVENLASDIRNFLTGRPVVARPSSLGYTLSRFVGRNRGPVLAGCVIVLSLIVGMITTASESRRARHAEQSALSRFAASEEIVAFLLDVFETADPRESLDTEIDAVEILHRGAQRIRTELTDQPRVRATLMNAIGSAYRSVGELGAARPLLEEALEIRRRELGDNDLETAASYDRLGVLLRDLGEMEEAERLLRRGLEIRDGRGDASVADRAASENNLGLTLKGLGRSADAVTHLEKALDMRRELYGEEHREVAACLGNLANIEYGRGNYEKAENMHRRTLAIRRRVLDARHPDIGQSLNNLAVTLRAQGKSDEAAALYREALEFYRDVSGDSSGRTAQVMSHLASVLRDSGRNAEAMRLFHRALDIQLEVLGPGHPDAAMTRNHVAMLHLQNGRIAAAREQLEEALRAQREAYEGDHRHVAFTLSHFGQVAASAGRTAEALEYFGDAAAMYERLHGPDHPVVRSLRKAISSLRPGAGAGAGAGG